jgi:protein O-GlcNAc transferase
MDYCITDTYLNPPGRGDEFFTEELVRLEGCYWCYDPADATPEVKPRAAEAPVTFASLNKFSKHNAHVLNLWKRVLNAVPGSRLALLLRGGEQGSASALAALDAAGIARERIDVHGRRERAGYIELFNQVDVSVDPFPYPGHTTTLDSLWMGVPVVTLEGDAPISRGSGSILNAMGLKELIARNEDDYVRSAVELARNSARRSELRATLRERTKRSTISDGAAFARRLEAAYRSMWKRWIAMSESGQR